MRDPLTFFQKPANPVCSTFFGVTRYRCKRCKYVYDPQLGDPETGIPEGTPFSSLPAGWRCPISGAQKSDFYPLPQEIKAPSASVPATQAAPAQPGVANAATAFRPGAPALGAAQHPGFTVGSLKKSSGSS